MDRLDERIRCRGCGSLRELMKFRLTPFNCWLRMWITRLKVELVMAQTIMVLRVCRLIEVG